MLLPLPEFSVDIPQSTLSPPLTRRSFLRPLPRKTGNWFPPDLNTFALTSLPLLELERHKLLRADPPFPPLAGDSPKLPPLPSFWFCFSERLSSFYSPDTHIDKTTLILPSPLPCRRSSNGPLVITPSPCVTIPPRSLFSRRFFIRGDKPVIFF